MQETRPSICLINRAMASIDMAQLMRIFSWVGRVPQRALRAVPSAIAAGIVIAAIRVIDLNIS